LRAGVEAHASTAEGVAAGAAAPEKLTLEQIFLRIVGAPTAATQELSWLS